MLESPLFEFWPRTTVAVALVAALLSSCSDGVISAGYPCHLRCGPADASAAGGDTRIDGDAAAADRALADGCVPLRCIDLARACGVLSDGCGSTVACGDCVAPESCGGGGVAGRCGREGWYGLGGSELAPHSERVTAAHGGGGVSGSSGAATGASLQLDRAGWPTMAWQDTGSGGSEIYVRRFDGAAWVELGYHSAQGRGISATGTATAGLALALDTAGLPTVAWGDNYSGEVGGIYVRAFDGVDWREVGRGSAGNSGISGEPGQRPRVVLRPDATPALLWSIGLDYFQAAVHAKGFDGNAWGELGAGSASGMGISTAEYSNNAPELILDSSGHLVAAWAHNTLGGDSSLQVRRFDGSGWQRVGPDEFIPAGIQYLVATLALTAAPANGVDLIWVEQNDSRTQIHGRRLDGAAWIDLGPGSTSGGGISQSAVSASTPVVCAAAPGWPVVAWADDSSGTKEIYLKRFDGSAWQPLAGTSASGGGVSNSEAASERPAIACGAGRVCVAWQEDVVGVTQILMRCADLS